MKNVRLPGFEPGLRAWEAHVITAGPQPRQCHRSYDAPLAISASII
jgi:hypothetical protein